ncbi:MAG TPA: inorganic diphosphatase [Kofleriaceae bacterium]|jgi:inorganic pyrophosphatase|nr:inorganic diphosphatase [Kofleriaceae bacterium]
MQYGKQWLKKVRKIEKLDKPLVAVCEIPARSRCKYKLDKKTGHLELGRIMAHNCAYPANYGFVPRTRSSDGEELDLLVITSEPLLPLTTVECTVVGGFVIKEQKQPPERKLLAVATRDPSVCDKQDLDEVDEKVRKDIEAFFSTYKRVEGIATEFGGWSKRAEALTWLQEALTGV